MATAKSAVQFRPGQPGSVYSNRALVVFACSTTVPDQQCVRSRVASGKLIDVWHAGICCFVCSCSCFRLLHRCIVHAVGLLPVFFVCAQYHANDHGFVVRASYAGGFFYRSKRSDQIDDIMRLLVFWSARPRGSRTHPASPFQSGLGFFFVCVLLYCTQPALSTSRTVLGRTVI